LKQFAAQGFHLIPLLSILAGLGIGYYFIKRQQHIADPLIDLKLFRSTAFGASLLIYMLGTFVVFSSFIYIFQYMQLLLKLSPIQAGLWSLPFFLAFIIGSLVTPGIVGKNHPLKVMAIGLFISVAGFALITQVSNSGGLAFLVTGCFIYCLGMAPIFTLTTDLVVGSAPPERAGVASALSETGSEFGGALGIAIIGSLGTFIYRSQLADSMPAGISRGIATDATQTLSEAVEQSVKLPAPIGEALEIAAGKAFISAMHLTAIVSMVIVTGMAILCLVLYRRLK
jgi:DHA2 family multidrug resistance protein-like MFS transporter